MKKVFLNILVTFFLAGIISETFWPLKRKIIASLLIRIHKIWNKSDLFICEDNLDHLLRAK